jgi:hypothetical protein
MHNSIQIIGNLERDPEQRDTRSHWRPVLGAVRRDAAFLEERPRRMGATNRLAPRRLFQSVECRRCEASSWRPSGRH